MDKGRRRFVKGAIASAAAPLILSSFPKFAYAQVRKLQEQFVEVKAGDLINLYCHPYSTDIAENDEGERFWVVVNGKTIISINNWWGYPVPLQYKAQNTTTLRIELFCDENVNGVIDNFADLTVIRNGSLVFTQKAKASAARAGFASALGTLIVGGAAFSLGCSTPASAPFCGILFALGGTTAVSALGFGYVATDPPDMNYQRGIVPYFGSRPNIPYSPFTFASDAKHYVDALMDAAIQMIGYSRAMHDSTDCAQGALIANDLSWEQYHRETAQYYGSLFKAVTVYWREYAEAINSRLGWGVDVGNNWNNVLGFQQALFNTHSVEQHHYRLPGTTGGSIREYIVWIWRTLGLNDREIELTFRALMPVPHLPRAGYVSVPPGYEPAIPVPPQIFPQVLVWMAEQTKQGVALLP